MSSGDDPRLGDLLVPGLTGHVVVCGFPHDAGCTRNGGRPGACSGPAAFRRFLPRMGCLSNLETGVTLDTLRISDGGDCASGPGVELEDAHRSLEALTLSALAGGGIPFVVGGGNDQSYPNACALLSFTRARLAASTAGGAAVASPADAGGGGGGAALVPRGARGITVINIDAHLDVRPLKSGRAHSGSPFRLLLETPEFRELPMAGRFVEFAAQGSQCSAEHARYVAENGGDIVWLSDLRSSGGGGPSSSAADGGGAASRAGDAALRQATRVCGDDAARVALRFLDVLERATDAVFVSFDIDSISAADCPGVSCPGTRGLSADEALAICFVAGRHPAVRLVDLSELNPAVEDYLTPRLAVNMFYYFCMGLQERLR